MTSVLPRSSTTQTNTTLPFSQPGTQQQSRKRFIANPIRPQQKPVPLRSTQTPVNAATNSSSQLSQQPPPTTTSTQPPLPLAAALAAPQIGGMEVTDATTLPRARVLEVTRRLDGSFARLAIRVQLLATGEEKEIDDRGGGPISIAADIQAGDLITLSPSGPNTFQWQKSTDPDAAAQLKPKKKRRIFTVDDLLSPLGVARILNTFPHQRWKGYGHEREDVARLCWLYKVWMSEMFPHMHPAVLTRRVEVMGGTRRVQRYMDAFRYEGKVKGEREDRDKRQKVGDEVVDEAAATVVEDRERVEREREVAARMLDEVYGDEAEQQAAQSAEQAALEEELLQQQEQLAEEPLGMQESFARALRELGHPPPLPVDEAAPARARIVETSAEAMDEGQAAVDGEEAAVDAHQPSETQHGESTAQQQQAEDSVPDSPGMNIDTRAAEEVAEERGDSDSAQQQPDSSPPPELTMVPETLELAAGELELHETAPSAGAQPAELRSDEDDISESDSTAKPDAAFGQEADEIQSSLSE